MTVELQLEEVGKTFASSRRAVDQVTFTVTPGEYLAIIGPSGCGKTTLLRLIAGLDTPSEGTIRIGGQVVNDTPSHRRDVAMMFQRPALTPTQSIRQNLRWAWSLRDSFAGVRRWFGGERQHEVELR
ncbi:MAG TPA: ATP-binding cassette domain-containing protein, partial [Gemmataceae bacterium]|nr:ATP-binding cassette domain-containing protein [Gemmataceae bacterium]